MLNAKRLPPALPLQRPFFLPSFVGSLKVSSITSSTSSSSSSSRTTTVEVLVVVVLLSKRRTLRPGIGGSAVMVGRCPAVVIGGD